MTSIANNQPSSNLHLTKQTILMKKAFAKIFKKDEKQIAKLVDSNLFSESTYHLARIFECLGKVKKEKLINVLISLEYLAELEFNNNIKDIFSKVAKDVIE